MTSSRNTAQQPDSGFSSRSPMPHPDRTAPAFTKGLRLDGGVIRGQLPDGRERPVAEIYRHIGVRVDHEAIANAALFVAAPGLLEAATCLPTHWLKSGILTDPRSDELRIEIRIVGTSYEAEMTVGELRAADAAIDAALSRAGGSDA